MCVNRCACVWSKCALFWWDWGAGQRQQCGSLRAENTGPLLMFKPWTTLISAIAHTSYTHTAPPSFTQHDNCPAQPQPFSKNATKEGKSHKPQALQSQNRVKSHLVSYYTTNRLSVPESCSKISKTYRCVL